MLLVEVVGVVGASRMQQGFALLCYAVMLCMHNSALRFVRSAYVITIDRPGQSEGISMTPWTALSAYGIWKISI